MPTVKEIAAKIEGKRVELQPLFEQARKSSGLEAANLVTQINNRNNELTDLGKELETARQIEDMSAQNEREIKLLRSTDGGVPFAKSGGGGDLFDAPEGSEEGDEAFARVNARRVSGKTLGELFVASNAYKNFKTSAKSFESFEIAGAEIKIAREHSHLKATFSNTSGALTSIDRQAGIIPIEQQRLFVADLLAQGETTAPTIRFMKEESYSNAATAVAEGGLKPEADFDLVESDAPVRKIAVTAKVTDEMFADFPQVRDYINSRMEYMVAAREEALLLNGNGTSPNIRGIMQTTGIQTQAKGTDPIPDAIYRGITKIRVNGFFEPTGCIIHPNDWLDVRLLRTADGLYIWGSPADAGPERIWGLPLVVTTSIAENTALVGAFRLGAQVFRRQGITMEATNSNEDDFKNNLVAIRVEERLALAVYRPLAFCTVTGV